MRKLISLVLAASLLLMTPVMIQADIRTTGMETEAGVNIMIDHAITDDSYGEFMEATAHRANTHFNLFLHTIGGDAFSTVGIMNRILDLKDRGCTFTTIVHSRAMSAGGYLFLMGDERIAYEGSTLMFHAMTQQVTKQQLKDQRLIREKAVQLGFVERMDAYVEARFRKVVGDRMSEKTIQYFLDGPEDGTTGSQYMSAKTAFNTGVATKFISADR